MIFVSFYTKNTPYEQVMFTHLKPSLDKWKLPYHIDAITDLGSWQSNTGYKATYILKMLNKYREDICFLDADATIEHYPELLFNIPKSYDLGIHFLDWFLHWRNITGKSKMELLSGTMILKCRPSTINLVENWVKGVKSNKNIWEQKVLEKLVLNDSNCRVYNLPPEYCAIKLHNGKIPNYIKNPVIIHHQVSRKLKRR